MHLLVSELIEMGILSEIREKTKRKIVALPPERFENILELEENSIKKKRSLMTSLIDSVYNDTSYIMDATGTQVKYYNTVESIDWLYDQILESKEVRTFVNSTEIIKVFPDNWNRFSKAVAKGIRLWDLHVYDSEITNPFDEMPVMYPNCHIKKFPPSVNFESMDYLLYENKIAVIYGFPRPHAIVIENESYYKMSVVLYDLIWNLV